MRDMAFRFLGRLWGPIDDRIARQERRARKGASDDGLADEDRATAAGLDELDRIAGHHRRGFMFGGWFPTPLHRASERDPVKEQLRDIERKIR